jgi:uncharacterized protein
MYQWRSLMPVQKVGSGYRWGQQGKIYPTRKQAEEAGQAAYANGYKPQGQKQQ